MWAPSLINTYTSHQPRWSHHPNSVNIWHLRGSRAMSPIDPLMNLLIKWGPVLKHERHIISRSWSTHISSLSQFPVVSYMGGFRWVPRFQGEVGVDPMSGGPLCPGECPSGDEGPRTRAIFSVDCASAAWVLDISRKKDGGTPYQKGKGEWLWSVEEFHSGLHWDHLEKNYLVSFCVCVFACVVVVVAYMCLCIIWMCVVYICAFMCVYDVCDVCMWVYCMCVHVCIHVCIFM